MITTKRNIFLGIHVTPEVKHALMREVLRRREGAQQDLHLISQSLISYELIKEALIEKGYTELTSEM